MKLVKAKDMKASISVIAFDDLLAAPRSRGKRFPRTFSMQKNHVL